MLFHTYKLERAFVTKYQSMKRTEVLGFKLHCLYKKFMTTFDFWLIFLLHRTGFGSKIIFTIKCRIFREEIPWYPHLMLSNSQTMVIKHQPIPITSRSGPKAWPPASSTGCWETGDRGENCAGQEACRCPTDQCLGSSGNYHHMFWDTDLRTGQVGHGILNKFSWQ